MFFAFPDDDYSCQTTNEGPQKFEECILPFLLRSTVGGIYRKYNNCVINKSGGKIRWWCSTKVDHFGIHIEGRGNWGYCADDCPIQNNTQSSVQRSQKKTTTIDMKCTSLIIYNIVYDNQDKT